MYLCQYKQGELQCDTAVVPSFPPKLASEWPPQRGNRPLVAASRRFTMAEPEMRPAEMCNEFTSQGSIGRPTCLGSVQAGHWTGGPALPTEAKQSLAAEAQRLQHLAQQRLGASAVVPSFEAFLASRHPSVAPNALILDSAAPPIPSAVAHASAPQPSSPEQAGSGESSSPVTPSTPLRSAPSSAPSSPLHSPAEPVEPRATTAAAAPCAAGAEPPAEPPARIGPKSSPANRLSAVSGQSAQSRRMPRRRSLSAK